MQATGNGPIRRIGMIPLRSFFPLVALIILSGTLVWGAWVSLLLAFLFWRFVGRAA